MTKHANTTIFITDRSSSTRTTSGFPSLHRLFALLPLQLSLLSPSPSAGFIKAVWRSTRSRSVWAGRLHCFRCEQVCCFPQLVPYALHWPPLLFNETHAGFDSPVHAFFSDRYSYGTFTKLHVYVLATITHISKLTLYFAHPPNPYNTNIEQ